LELRLIVRDRKKRLTEVKLVAANEELAAKARNGVVQAVWRIKPTDSAVLVLRDKSGVLAFLLVRWTPLVFAERVGIVADAGVVPVNIGQCEECRLGESIARQVYIKVPELEEGFVRVYRRLKKGDPVPDQITDLPHFALKPVAWVRFGDFGQGGAYVGFVRSIPPLEPQEAVKILCQEVRLGTPYEPPKFLPGQRGKMAIERWEFYDIQRRRYVAVAWEVRIRRGALPPPFSSHNEAAYRTCDIAREIVKGLPLSPPNDVAAVLVEKLRRRVKGWRIGLMPRATLWFEGNVIKGRGEFYEPPKSPRERQGWDLVQEFVKFLREGKAPVKFMWSDQRAGTGGSVKLKWVRWLKSDKASPPNQREQVVAIGQPVFVPVDAEYEVEPEAPEGFKSVRKFRLSLEIKPEPLSPHGYHQIPLSLSASDPEVRVGIGGHYRGKYPDPNHQLVVGVEVPLTLVYLWELRVTFNRIPVKGELKIVLEGNGRRWEQEAFARLTGSWDIPVHSRWLFPDPRRPGVFIAKDSAVFQLIPPGRYTLRVEGTIGGEARLDVSPFPGKPKIVTKSEPVRQVRWQKRVEVKAGSVEVIVVPLPR